MIFFHFRSEKVREKKPETILGKLKCYLSVEKISYCKDIVLLNFFFYMDTQDHAIYHVWIHFIPTTLYLRREMSCNRTQVLLLHKRPLKPLDHGSSGIVLLNFLLLN